MADSDTRYTFDRVVRMVLSAITLVALFMLLRYLSDVLLPFVAAVVLAYLLNPLVTQFERKTKRRGLAVGLTLAGLGVVALALLVAIIPLMFGQIRQFGVAIEKLRGDLATSVNATATALDAPATAPSDRSSSSGDSGTSTVGWRELKEGWAKYREDAGTVSRADRLANLRAAVGGTYIGDVLEQGIRYVQSDQFNTFLGQAAKKLLGGAWTVVSFAVNFVLALTGLIVVLLYLVFLLLDYPAYARTWKTFLPPQYRDTIVEFWEHFETAMRQYFRGQSVVALLTGVLFVIGFTSVGLPMAVPFGLFLGLLNMVPYLQTVGLVPAVFLAGIRAIEGDASFVVSVALVLLVFGIVQVIQDALIVPRVMGKATGLRPVAILLGVFIWGKLLGFMGLLMAIPLTCLGIAYYRRIVLNHAASETRLASDE